MKLIQLITPAIYTGESHTSKGNQLKWEADGWWYKADAFGYESLAECVVSHVLSYSNIENAVCYEPVWIQYRGNSYRGCRSRNFRKQTEELIPLERLVRNFFGVGLAQKLTQFEEVSDKIHFTEKVVRMITGIQDFGPYLAALLEIDAFFLNEDRHTNNIAVLYNSLAGTYRPCPFFDMGLSLFSDTKDMYPLTMQAADCCSYIMAKPFNRDFDIQLDAASELYGNYLQFSFSANQIGYVFHEVQRKYGLNEAYTTQELNRVEETLRRQARKYQYFFK